MPVLDYPRKTSTKEIIIPPFHTGHLGLIPGSEVFIGLIAQYSIEFQHEHHGCEIKVSTFQTSAKDLFRLECIMKDQPGVVERLIRSIASLDLNIVLLESSGIDHLNRHLVSMVIDWGTATKKEFKRPHDTPSNVKQQYFNLHSILPLNDRRYIELYQRIIAQCGDIIDISEDSDPLPNIFLKPFEERLFLDQESSMIERIEDITDNEASTSKNKEIKKPKRSFHVKFKIPRRILRRILHLTDRKEGEDLWYILISEPETRELRVYFPRKEREQRFVHVAFSHKDVPGALNAITRVVANSDFNIITSLLRKIETGEGVWTAVLEGAKHYGNPPSSEKERIDWLAKLLQPAANALRVAMAYYEVVIRPPLYPKPKTAHSVPLFSKVDEAERALLRGLEVSSSKKSLVDGLEKIEKQLQGDDTQKGRLSILVPVLRALKKERPEAFLSYPWNASSLAEFLREELQKNNYDVSHYQDPDLRSLTEEVIERIRAADFFIGIWHHEKELKEGGYTTSPWMPSEFGIASALGKPNTIVYSDKLHESVWHRMEKDVSKIRYSETSFAAECVPIIIDYWNEYWRNPMI